MTPFVHKFETNLHKYVYDVNSNRVYKVTDLAYQIIEEYRDGNIAELIKRFPHFDKRELKQAFREIQTARKKHGIFSSSRPSRMGFHADIAVENLIASKPHEQLILNVTERCNLRCSYCVYGGAYPGMRTHGSRDMSFDTAMLALQGFLRNCDEHSAVSFYGGEPLLNIELIKHVVNEVESRHDGRIEFSMTTNGTLLDPDVVDFLREKEFYLLISLDGPQEVHDSHRVDSSGRGSFDRVMRNLDYVYSRHKAYYDKKIAVSTVNAPPTKMERVKEFFATEPLVKNQRVTFSFVEGINDIIRPSLNEEDIIEAKREAKELRDAYIQELKGQAPRNVFLTGWFEKGFARYYHRPKIPLGSGVDLNGCCIPGARRLFVTVDGELHVCERLDNAYPIGSVENWVEPRLIRKLVDDYIAISSEDCLSCWMCRLCSDCFATLYRLPNCSDPAIRRERCDQNRMDLHSMMVAYYSLLEKDPSALDFLEHVTFS